MRSRVSPSVASAALVLARQLTSDPQEFDWICQCQQKTYQADEQKTDWKLPDFGAHRPKWAKDPPILGLTGRRARPMLGW